MTKCKYCGEDPCSQFCPLAELATLKADIAHKNKVIKVFAVRIADMHAGCKQVVTNSIESWKEWAEAKVKEAQG